MAANTSPIFPIAGNITWAVLTTANTAKDGTGSAAAIFTAGANGGRVDTVKVRAKGTNTATVLRLFINNGSNQEVAANNALYMEKTIASTTLSEVAELVDNEIALNLVLPAGYKITATLGTTVAAGLVVTAVGGDY